MKSCKTQYIYFCQFEIFVIETAEIYKENDKNICDSIEHITSKIYEEFHRKKKG